MLIDANVEMRNLRNQLEREKAKNRKKEQTDKII